MTANSRTRTLPSLPRQRGSTLTGLIIGLIVGLGIAVAVALTITKGASPFTDKTAKAGRPADPAPGQTIDPNKPMYSSRDAARSANKEVEAKVASRNGNGNGSGSNGAGSSSGNVNLNNGDHVERAAPPAPAAAPALSAAPARPAAPADADPLGQVLAGLKERAPAKSDAHADTHAAPAAPSTAASGDYVYYLQAGAFREISDAEATRAKLALLGFEAAISDRTSDSGVLHRVRMGPYNQVESMNKARAKLLDSGVDVAIVRNQR
jgi:cell division protein FtsN